MLCDYVMEFTNLIALSIYYVSELLVHILCVLDYSFDKVDFCCVGPVNRQAGQR